MGEERYALRDRDDRVDGEGTTWWLYLPNLGIGVPHVGPFPLEKAQQHGWWRVPSWAEFDPDSPTLQPVEVVRSPGKTLVYWQLNEAGAKVAGYTSRLTPDEYRDRTDDESEEWDKLVAVIYEPVYEDLPPTRERIEGPWLVLDGAPPPKDGHEWHASLPHALRHAPEYLHLFPGHLDGFRAALKTALEKVQGVSVYTSGGGPISVNVRLAVPKLEPPEKWAARLRLEGRNARERKAALEQHNASIQQITRQLEIPVSDRVHGENRARAVAAWDETVTEIVEYVQGVVAEKCPTCGGRGFVDPHNHEED